MARKILLADDSVTAQNMGRRILSDAGYEVTTVNNGSAALKKVAESKPDLIVLDVYMPGYGGLEVCQRLRESDDTARIPVLLTVGKLEPFKVEEVRRVHADAFIVKPFEASELLTALTKLEDKIVPQPQPRRPGRLPKPGDRLDDFAGSGRQYGDTETGWKSRLRIPPPHRKTQPEFPEPEPDRPRAVAQGQEQGREQAEPKLQAKPVQAQEVPAPPAANVPLDITADEIAAIQAAAAAFSMPIELAAKPEVESEPSPKEKPVAEAAVAPPSVSADGQAESAASALPEAASSLPVPEPPTPAQIAATSQPDTPAEFPVQAEVIAAPESSPCAAPEQTGADHNKLAEHEVAAVLASLEFVNATSVPEPESDEPFFATIAAAPAREEFSGPRWIAASVPLTEEESSLILEQEMQKAMAAMASTDTAEAPAVVPDTIAVSEAVEPVVPAAPPVAGDSSEPRPQEPAFEPAASQTEEQPASAQLADALASPTQPAAAQEEAAYAAAASTGSAISETTVSIEAASPAPAPESTPAAEPAEPQRESELAAAWASWKQIRESVVSPQLAAEIAEVAASSTSASEPPQASAATETETGAANDSSSDAPGESEAIAGIVDTVLAELKPKLMQEIAKKMAKSKKQKK